MLPPRRRDFVDTPFSEEQTRWGSISKGGPDGFQTNEPQGHPTERRRVGRWVDLGSTGPRTRARPLDGPGIGQRKRLSDDPGEQGDDRLRRALSFRDLGTNTAPDGQQGFTRRVREGVPRGLAVAGFCWQRHAIVAPLYSDDPPVLHS